MELKRFERSRLHHMEHFQFASHVLRLCEEANLPKLNDALPPLVRAINNEDRALNRPRRLPGTEELRLLDKERDNAYQALRLLMMAQIRSDDDAVVKAAKVLEEVMSRYPRTPISNYDMETGMIKNLITDLKEPEVAAQIVVLGMKHVVERLERVNKKFDVEFHHRVQIALPSGTYNVKALRAAVNVELEFVLKRIEALDNLEPSAEVEKLIKNYNNLVDNRRMLLAHRKATNRSARERDMERSVQAVTPLIPVLEHKLNLTAGSISFARKTLIFNRLKYYLLNVADSEPIWVCIKKGKPVITVDPTLRRVKRKKKVAVEEDG